jgi:cytochrome P450
VCCCAHVQSVVDALLFAGLIGTSTLIDTTALPRFRGVYVPDGPRARPEELLSATEHLALYHADAHAWLLEAVRLQPPVQSTSQVAPTGGLQCPFRGASRVVPAGTFVVANLYHASVDRSEWGDDALAFRPGRSAARHLNWNGPYGGNGPRQCPGEALSVALGRVMLDAWVAARHGNVADSA